MNMETPIAPCPFCGAPGDLEEISPNTWAVCCNETKCWAMGPIADIYEQGQDEAVRRWNQRRSGNAD